MDRLEMARLAVQGAEGFRVYAGEIERGGSSFTIDTIAALKQENPDGLLTLLIGADQLPKLHTWRRIGEILTAARIAVLGRPNSHIPSELLEQTLGPQTAEEGGALAGACAPP